MDKLNNCKVMENIKLKKGNIFESRCQVIVNTVNCAGIMGKGIALEAKNRYPEMFNDYKKRCDNKLLKMGEPYLFTSMFCSILNFPTKEHWRSVSKISDIEKGLDYLIENYEKWGIQSIAVPPLGCGYGGLKWSVVGKLLYRKLSKLNISVELYVPNDCIPEEMEDNFLRNGSFNKETKTTYPVEVIAALEILRRIKNVNASKNLGRVFIQKIFFMALLFGIPIPYKFERKPYGPFSDELRKKITEFVNNGLIIEHKYTTDRYDYEIGPTYNDYYLLIQDLVEKYNLVINKIVSFLLKMDHDQIELASTTGFVLKEYFEKDNELPNEMDILIGIHDWKKRRTKGQFTEHQILSCFHYLIDKLKDIDTPLSNKLKNEFIATDPAILVAKENILINLDDYNNKINELLAESIEPLKSSEILDILNITVTPNQLTYHLKKLHFVDSTRDKRGVLKFFLKGHKCEGEQKDLFKND